MSSSQSSGAVTEAETLVRTRHAPRFNLILLDDDEHSYEYVIGMLMQLFAFSFTKAFLCADEVDNSGRVILITDSLERVEFKQEQVHAFGSDPSIRRCAGAMSAVIEEAP